MTRLLPVTLQGTVARFKGNGRKLGYPTANLITTTDLEDGIYFGHADLAEWSGQPAMIFIGVPTTVGDRRRRIEVYLLDIPDRDYYDQPLAATAEHYHRPNQTFEGVEELIKVIRADEQAARVWFAAANANAGERGSSSAG
jgi:riboflavin kinase/FMN adenylyltransferase